MDYWISNYWLYEKRKRLSFKKRKGISNKCFRLFDLGDFTKDSDNPPQWIIRQLQFEKVLFATWGLCFCGVIVGENINLAEDPLDAPTEYLEAEPDQAPEENAYWAKY